MHFTGNGDGFKESEKRPVDTVFIGGGTPSVPECDVMEKLLQGLRLFFVFGGCGGND